MTATVIELDQEGPARHPADRGRHHLRQRGGPHVAPTAWPRRTRASAVVLDFSKLEYMNSGGIGLLVTLLVRAQRGGGRGSSRPACPSTTARSSR